MARLNRRQFVAGASGALLVAGCGRWPWQVEPAVRMPRVGYLGTSGPGAPGGTFDEAFVEGLSDLGYVEGKNIVFERRFLAGETPRASALVTELVQLPVDVLVVARSNAAIQAAQSATSTTPIVGVPMFDPVVAGWIQSLARPGGNLTGVSQLTSPLMGKRLQLLMETVPTARRIGMFWDSNELPLVLQETATAAQVLGLELLSLPVWSANAFEQAVEMAAAERLDALIVPPGSLINGVLGQRVWDFAVQHRLATMHSNPGAPREGAGLMGYGPKLEDLHRRAAYYVDRILKGANPADLPVEQPMTFDFVVNLKTARELGITFPNEIMLQVTEVID